MASPSEALERNVLLLGRTGVGKSTLGNHVSESDVFDVSSSPDPCTKEPSFTVFELPGEHMTYKVKVIDTVGLFDGQKKAKKVIFELKSYLQKSFRGGISLVLFVMKKGRYDEMEKKAFKFILDNFNKDVSGISALVITGCDSMSPERRQQYVQEFSTCQLTSSIAEFMQKGVITVGFPDVTGMDEDDPLQKIFKRKIKEDAAVVRDVIIGAEEMTLKKELFDDKWWELLYKLKNCSLL